MKAARPRPPILAIVALFVALGGTAYATHPGGADTISSGDIIDNQVRTQDIRDQAVGTGKLAPDSVVASKVEDDSLTGADVEDESLSGDDVDANSLTGPDIDEPSLDAEQLPATASFASQIRDVGTDGDVLYGGGSGRTTASVDMSDVQMLGGPSYEIFGIQAWVETAPGAGESRSFKLVRRGGPDGAILDTAVDCTIGEGERFCEDSTLGGSLNSNLFAIEIESVGAGLSSTDDAYVGLTVGG